ncbi:MAG: NAD(P)H-hydrate dehydratase [Candidatus Heimdallarchaeota archaeon]|nr:NAD(P)H-hydrate dehydratase [Candidatus Heimdallarchaeota archaeon]
MVATAEKIRILDMNSEELGVDAIQLMENAGSTAAYIILQNFPKAKKIVICCGTGNNGGDGFVVARHLAAAKKEIKLFLFGQESKIRTREALTNYKIIEKMECSIEIIKITDSTKLSHYISYFNESDLIIDALLGIGITNEPYEPIKRAIEEINNSGKQVVSIDIPSGMFSDIAKRQRLMVEPTLIVTFHDTKPCLMIDDLKEKTIITEIGVPPEADFFTGIGDLYAAIPKRKPTSHKGENGTILFVGGSIKYSGAPVLSSRAALRTGADLVVTCIPQSIATSVRSDSPNLIVRALDTDYLTELDIPIILELFEKFDSLILGPGLSDNPETMKFVRTLVKQLPNNKPIIIDADAIRALKDNLELVKGKKVLITPHQGEFKNLFGEGLPEDWRLRPSYIEKIAKKYSLVILLKSKYDIISDGKNTKVNRTGHEGMTKGGTGDVLAGILGLVSAVNKDYFKAACAAAYLSGKAGELAAEDYGNSLLATDVVEKIPDILLQMEKIRQ